MNQFTSMMLWIKDNMFRHVLIALVLIMSVTSNYACPILGSKFLCKTACAQKFPIYSQAACASHKPCSDCYEDCNNCPRS